MSSAGESTGTLSRRASFSLVTVGSIDWTASWTRTPWRSRSSS